MMRRTHNIVESTPDPAATLRVVEIAALCVEKKILRYTKTKRVLIAEKVSMWIAPFLAG